MQPAIFLTTITHCAACYIPHNYSLCSLLYSSQQLLTVQPAIFLTTITHCAACYILHSNFSALYAFQRKCCLLFLFRQCYKKNQGRAFRSLPNVTAFNICFSGGRLWQHHSASGDCTNHKRFGMQQ